MDRKTQIHGLLIGPRCTGQDLLLPQSWFPPGKVGIARELPPGMAGGARAAV